ncbi:MAG: hypothetical protein MHMPM18_004478 [Marteilia pararefringens]
MTFEQFLERKVDLRSELSTVEEINDSMEAPQVLDLDSYIDVIVSKEKRLDIKDACHELYRQIDISHKYQHLMQNDSNGYYFASNEAKSDKKRKLNIMWDSLKSSKKFVMIFECQINFEIVTSGITFSQLIRTDTYLENQGNINSR